MTQSKGVGERPGAPLATSPHRPKVETPAAAARPRPARTSWAPNAAPPSSNKAPSAADLVASATAMAAFKALISSANFEGGTGLPVSAGQLADDEFKAALETLFGPGALASISADGTFTPGPTMKPNAATDFKALRASLLVDPDGGLTVAPGSSSRPDLPAQVQRTFGSASQVSDGKIILRGPVPQAVPFNYKLTAQFGQSASLTGTFNDAAGRAANEASFQGADLNRTRADRFGQNASLNSTIKASVDREGATSAEAATALCVLMGNTTIDTTAGLTITNKTLTRAQFGVALKHVLGPAAKVSANGALTWAKGTDGNTITSIAAGFKAVHDAVTLDASGRLTLKDGQVSGDLTQKLTAMFGTGFTLTSENTFAFKGAHVTSAAFTQSLKKQFGETASVGASVKTSFDEQGLSEVAVSLEAFKQLRAWGDAGHLDITSKGSVVVKDGAVAAAQVEAALSAVAGTDVKIGVGGKLSYAAGKPKVAEFSNTLSKAWGSTRVDTGGTLRLVDGKPHTSAHLKALLGGPQLNVGANLAIEGLHAFKAGATVSTGGPQFTTQTTASFSKADGTTTAALQTKLVTTGDRPVAVSVGSFISVSDTQKAAEVKTQLSAGGLTGALGVGVSAGVKLYTPGPLEPGRRAVAQAGGVWAERSNSFDLSASAGGGPSMQIGAATISLGFTADGSKKREVHVLSVHDSKEAALREGAVTVIHPPDSLEAIRAMQPFEQYSDSGTQSVGLGGNVSVGYGVGPASISIGGQVYYQVTGNLSRDFERLEGDKVRVRFRKQDGSVSVRAITASIGLSGSKLLGDNALSKAAAPLLENVAHLGFKASVEKSKHNASLFDVEIDLSTPRGQVAMQRVLQNDLSEAQYWAHYPGSGVKLNSSVSTSLNVASKTVDVNLAGLSAEHLTRWLEKTTTEVTAESYTFTQTLDYTQKSDPLLPWQPSRMSDVRFLNRRQVDLETPTSLPELGEPPAPGAPLTMRVPPPAPAPTLENSKAVLGVRVKITDAKSSLSDVTDTLDTAMQVMNAVGYEPKSYQKFSDFRRAVKAGVAPERKSVLMGLGDRRFGETSLDLRGYVGPAGFEHAFTRPDGAPRTHGDYERAYLDSAGLTSDGSVASEAGLRAAIEKKLHASLQPQANGEFAVVKDGARIGTLAPGDFAQLRRFIDEFTGPSNPDQTGPWYQEVRMTVGTWVATPPRALFELDSEAWQEVTTVRQRARSFADAMQTAARLRAENAPGTATEGPLFNKPDAYFDQLNQLFERTVRNDGDRQTAALTMLRLAGKEGISARAAFNVPKKTTAKMIDAAQKAVQRFGATTLLAAANTTVTGEGHFEFDSGSDPQAAERIARALFGAKATVRSNAGRATVTNIEWPEEHKLQLLRLLSGGRGADGSLRVPANWSPDQARRFMRDVVGAPTQVTEGRMVFDNRGYALVSIGDALSTLGAAAFGARAPGQGFSLFAVAVPIENEPLKQDPNAFQQFMVAKHQGSQAVLGDWVDELVSMRTDLAKPDEPPSGWVLTSR